MPGGAATPTAQAPRYADSSSRTSWKGSIVSKPNSCSMLVRTRPPMA